MQIDEMSLWQLTAQSEGYADAHAPANKKAMSVTEFDAIAERLD